MIIMKDRCFDLFLSIPFAVFFFIPCLILLLLKWLEDKANPIYAAVRVTKNGRVFSMYKIRTMVPNAHLLGGSSTANSDRRISPMGKFFRTYKLDELLQLINVIKGDLSLVGVRPTTIEEFDSFTPYEKIAFSKKAGLTDLSSILFSDEGSLLNDAIDPDALYQEKIRPLKSQLGVLYAKNICIKLNIQIIFLTIFNFINRNISLKILSGLLDKLQASLDICEYVNQKLDAIVTKKTLM